METQNTPASYQSGGAGVISLVRKSGTNKIHGDVSEYSGPTRWPQTTISTKYTRVVHRGKKHAAVFYRYQEGGAIGGPILKDKLFYFGDYEDTQQQQFEGKLTSPFLPALNGPGTFRRWASPSTIRPCPDNPSRRHPAAVSGKQNPQP